MGKRYYYEEYRTIDEMINEALKYTKYKNIVKKLRDIWKALVNSLPKGQNIYCISNDPAPIIQRQWDIEDFCEGNKEDVFLLHIPWQEFSPGQEIFLVTATEGIYTKETAEKAVEEEIIAYLYSMVIPRFKSGKTLILKGD
jgi:ribosomal protein S8